jgi:hypothetical protein
MRFLDTHEHASNGRRKKATNAGRRASEEDPLMHMHLRRLTRWPACLHALLLAALTAAGIAPATGSEALIP